MTPDQAEAFIQERINKLRTFLGEPAAAAFTQMFNLAQLSVIYAAAATPLRKAEPEEHAALSSAYNTLTQGISSNIIAMHAVDTVAERKIREYIVECLQAVTLATTEAQTQH